jgi:multidrug efflux pump subunit AcrB
MSGREWRGGEHRESGRTDAEAAGAQSERNNPAGAFQPLASREQDRNLAPLYRLPGIAETRIVGSRPSEYQVLAGPKKLKSCNRPLTKVEAILNSNTIVLAQENHHLDRRQ